jgi:hypothetical protein
MFVLKPACNMGSSFKARDYDIVFSVAQQPAIGPWLPYWVSKSI